MKRTVHAAKTLAQAFLDDPETAKKDLLFRCEFFLDPPQVAAIQCDDGCCANIHVEEGTSVELLDAVSNGIANIREEHYGPPDLSDGDMTYA